MAYLDTYSSANFRRVATTHVTMIEAFGFQPQYLTFNGTGVALHTVKEHSANFHLDQVHNPITNQVDRFVQVFGTPNMKLHLPAPVNCSQSPNSVSVSSTLSTAIKTTPGSSNVMLYFEDSATLQKYYLRVNVFGGNTVELVCQQHIDSALVSGGLALQEVLFELVQVAISDIPAIPRNTSGTRTRFSGPGHFERRRSSSGSVSNVCEGVACIRAIVGGGSDSDSDEGSSRGRARDGFTIRSGFSRLDSIEVVVGGSD